MKTKTTIGSGRIVSSRQMGHDRERPGLYKERVPPLCNEPHPTERVRVAGVFRFLTCRLKPFHKQDHAADGRSWPLGAE